MSIEKKIFIERQSNVRNLLSDCIENVRFTGCEIFITSRGIPKAKLCALTDDDLKKFEKMNK